MLLLVELEDTSRLIPWSETPAVTWDVLICEFLSPSALPCVPAGTAPGSPSPSGAAKGSRELPQAWELWPLGPWQKGMR